MRIGIGNDHAGYDLKTHVVARLREAGHDVTDFGHHDTTSTDYPVYGRAVAHAVVAGEIDRGIVICGSGVGISIAANKVAGIRAVLCSEPYSALLSRLHNDTNVLALGARVVGIGLADLITDTWLDAGFEGGRHTGRVEQIEG